MLTGLPRAARRARLDLFHAPSYTAPVGGPRPLVLTIHDVSYERNPEWYPYKRDPLRRAFYRYSARSADRVITDSEFSKREIVDVYALRPDSIDVVPLAAAPAFCAGPPLPLPAGWPTHYVLHVGDLHARRNLPMLARAVAAVRSRKPAWGALGLVLAGVDRGTGADLQRLSERSGGSAPLVTFAGVDDRAAAARALSLGGRARLPVALRRIRPAAPRGHGLRHARHCRTDVVDSGSRRRRGGAARSGR